MIDASNYFYPKCFEYSEVFFFFESIYMDKNALMVFFLYVLKAIPIFKC